LFLDDIQWVDAGSIELLLYALRHPDSKNLLVVVASRDDDHPLRAEGVTTIDMPLRPLDAEAITALVGDALRIPDPEAASLANIVRRQTGGNPLFVSEVLTALQRDGAITFDHATARWLWDQRTVETTRLPDNLVGFVGERLEQLPKRTLDLLALAACLGAESQVRTLEIVADGAVHDVLAPAVNAGLVHRWGDTYRFAHDQVQRAAYALIPEHESAAVHARIGRRMLAVLDPTSDDALFTVANQLLRGASDSPDEARTWARVHLNAGIRAMSTSAFHAAARYLAAGAALLGDRGWQDDYELVHRLVAERSQAEHLAGNADEAERLCEVLLAHSRTALCKQVAYRRRIEVLLGRANAARAVEVCLEGLASLGMTIPSAPDVDDVDAEIAAIERAIGDRRIEDLVDLGAMNLSEMRAAVELLSVASPAAWYVNEKLSQIMLGRMVYLSVTHGNVDASAMGYVSYGIVLIACRADYQKAHAFGQLGYELGRRAGAYWSGMTENIFGAMIGVWTRPLRECLDHVRRSLVTTTQSGNVAFVAYNCSQLVMASLAAGRSLDELGREAEQLLQTARVLRSEPTSTSIESALAFTRALRGMTESVGVLSGPDFDEAAFTARVSAGDVPLAAFYHHLHKLKASLLARDIAGALSASEVVMRLGPALGSQYPVAESFFYAALAHLAAHEESATHLEHARRYAKPIATWAEACPANFLAMHRLLGAEIARVSASPIEAMKLYDQAAIAARDHELPHLEGLANELAARCHLELELVTSGAAYVRAARAAYAKWGAQGKVLDLERRYADLLAEPNVAVGPSARLDELDAVTVVKASEVIASELVVDRLATALLRLAVEHAGADFGMFFTCDDQEVVLAATAVTTSEGVAVEIGNTTRAVPWSIIHFVQRTRDALLVDEPADVSAFANDAMIARERPKSLFCLPLVRSAGLVGILYLQNGLVRGAFTPARCALLEVLCGHAIVALENARLYTDLVHENQQRARAEQALQQLNTDLEARVAERTEALRQVNQELESFSYSVSHDLKAPLRLVEWSTTALERELGKDAPRSVSDLLADVRRGNDHMRRMIDDLLRLWSVTSSEVRCEDVDLAEIGRDILASLARTEPDRKVELVVPEQARAEGDPRLLRIALENLLHNAWKFTAKLPRARVELGVEHSGTWFVRDDGAGFDMADAPKLFTPFQRLHDASEFPGTGIGLATVRRIVRLHGGRIWAEGKVDGGATFYFTL
jgi:signal transduction histidine kinase